MSDVEQKLIAAKLAMLDPRLRALAGKERTLVEEGNAYGEKVTKEEFDKLMDEVLTTELNRKKLLVLMEEEPLSVEMLAERTGLAPDEVFKNVLVLQRKGLIQMEKIEGNCPFYKAVKTEQ